MVTGAAMKKHEIPTPHPHHQQASASVAAALGTLPFPIDKPDAVRKVGDWKVPLAEGEKVPLGQILAALPQETFRNVGEATNAVDQHWGRIADMLAGRERTEQDEVAALRKKHE
jgi:hypothetical protein